MSEPSHTSDSGAADHPDPGGAAGERPVSGRWFEDLPEGLVVRHAVTRTITEADNTLFSMMTMNPQPLHLDAQFAAGTEFGERLVNSLFTLGLLVGVTVYELTLGTTIANLGFDKVEFPRPLFHGDTLHAESTVTGARASGSRPDAGIVRFEHRGYNQRDELVALCQRDALMRRRPD
ncbi:MAG TPA: MaoC family dehydratase [Solirubrobacterales bacterium]|jgi:acyl dehydratase|nr:MaoC family dehydratase [Solirubrobacterales bacterium]